MNWKEMMGFISTIVFLVPVLIIFLLRLNRFKCFLAVGIYYLLGFCNSFLKEGYLHTPKEFNKVFEIGYNLLDMPLMFIFLAYFSTSMDLGRKIRISVLVFLIFELTAILIFGYNKEALTIIMAPGLAAVLFFSALFFIRQIKITIQHQKATGKALMLSSLLFAYGCYALIYVMYYLIKTEDVTDVFVMYFIVTTLSALILSAGMLVENKRIRRLKELKLVRKELSMLYGSPESPKKVSAEIFTWNDDALN
jgi:hypothetical protein